MTTQIKCLYCKSTSFKKQGFRKTQNRGKIQKYKCFNCGKHFTHDNGFYRMRNSEQIITMSLDMYLSNLSSRKMRNQLRRHFNHKISHVAIMSWIYKYVRKVQKFAEGLKPQLSGKIYADETEVDCQGQKDIFWCAVDWDTRFINATLYSPKEQNIKDAYKFVSKIKDANPHVITTDGLLSYPKAIRKAFWNRSKKQIDVYHNVINYSETKRYNVRIETVFSKIKDRVKDFRGFKSVLTAPILMAGIVLQHNFIEAHTTTGKVPCELAGLKIVEGINRWLHLIRISS